MRQPPSLLLLSLLLVWGAACGSESPANTGTGATTGTGGTSGTGGAVGAGGSGTGGVAGGQGGSGGATGGGSGGRGGSGGASAGRGGGGGNASGGRGGGGGSQTTTCPAAPPQPGTNCAGGLTCYYEDCAGAGRTIATCVVGSVSAPRWSATTSSCTTVSCPNPSSVMCAAGQICLVRAGGAFLAECVSNSCGTSAISCDCLQSCTGVCTVVGSSLGGVTVSCNTCPQGGCP